MTQIRIKGKNGKPVRYASLDGQNLKLQFEYYARDDNEGDYEVIQTVSPTEFAAIASRYGLDPSSDIFTIMQQLSDSGHGEDFVAALNDKEIKCEIFNWLSLRLSFQLHLNPHAILLRDEVNGLVIELITFRRSQLARYFVQEFLPQKQAKH